MTDSTVICYCIAMTLVILVVLIMTIVVEAARWHWRDDARRLRMIRRIGRQP